MLIFVDCEARGTSPVRGTLTEFGCVSYPKMQTYHGRLFESYPDPERPTIPIVVKRVATPIGEAMSLAGWLKEVAGNDKTVLVSDNPAWDYMWIAGLFDTAEMENPFGHSGRRISDYWAGLNFNWKDTQNWKKFRQTKHDHNPVHDALGNAEAYRHIQEVELARRKYGSNDY